LCILIAQGTRKKLQSHLQFTDTTGDTSIGTETLTCYSLLLVYNELAYAASIFLLFLVVVFVPFKSLLKFICL
jgi:hypothetical protein